MSVPMFDLGHTPGIYYALAYVLSAIVFVAVNKKRKKIPVIIAASILFLVLITGFMFLTDGVTGIMFALSMLVIFSLIFVYIFFAIDQTWKGALYFTMRAFILGEFAASLEWLMFFFGINTLNLPLSIGVNTAFLLGIHITVFGISLFVEMRYSERNRNLVISARDIIIVLILGSFAFALSNLSFAFPLTPFSSQNNQEIFAIRTLADFGGALLLFAFHMQICELSARLEKEYLDKLLKMQEENFRLSAESVEIINRKYHDLKHYIGILRSEVSKDEKLGYLDELEDEIRSYEAQNKTGNKTLDIILTAKSLQCQNEGITLTSVADGKELAFMKPADICVLFGNALDNAVESTEKIADTDKRLIHLSVMRQKSFVRIRIENCCEGVLKYVGGIPFTTKADTRYHGYGIKSIRAVAEKYGGTMTAKLEGGWFELRVLIPVSETVGQTGPGFADHVEDEIEKD